MKLLILDDFFINFFKKEDYENLSKFKYITFNGIEIPTKDFLLKVRMFSLKKEECKLVNSLVKLTEYSFTNKTTLELIKININEINRNANGVKISLKGFNSTVDL